MLKKHQRQRTDATHVLASVRRLNRLEIVGETLHATLNALAVAVPDWLKQQVPVEWFEVYGKHFEEYRLPHDKKERETVAEVIGTDGTYLLHRVYDDRSPSWLREIPAVEILRQIWVQQFYKSGWQIAQIDLMGAIPDDNSWQARQAGYNSTQFKIDWRQQQAICPQCQCRDKNPQKCRVKNPQICRLGQLSLAPSGAVTGFNSEKTPDLSLSLRR